MSLLTRLAGFGLCILGGFTIGYAQGIQSIIGGIDHEINRVLGTTPGFAPALIPLVDNYIQQNIVPSLNIYLAVGVVLAAGGIVLVARGDREPKAAQQKEPLRQQSLPAK